MPWKERSIDEIAKTLGVDVAEVREKLNLIRSMITARQAQQLSQAALARKVGVSQSRIAQIESALGTANITFDVLLHILSVLDYTFKIVTKKTA